MTSLLHDLRFALRRLAKDPGFSMVAILTLALGIGACTAMFSVVQSVLLQPLPFEEPERLVWIENAHHGGGLTSRTTRVDNFLEWQKQSDSFEMLGAYFAFFDYQRLVLTGSGEPQRLRGVGVSKDFLDVLGVQPQIGRNFVSEETVWNARPVAILSHTFWQQKFNADPTIVGRSITIDGKPTEIVGVLPASFDFGAVFAPGTSVELLTPFPLVEQTVAWGNTLFAIGRLEPTVTLDEARSELNLIAERVQSAHPERDEFGARLSTLDDHVRGAFRPAFYLLSAAVACLLLIACVNLSNLLLARTNDRRRELAVRAALGADRRHLARQAVTESLLLAVGGTFLGAVLATLATEALAGQQALDIPMLNEASVDVGALGFTAVTACLVALLCAGLPVVRLWRHAPGKALSGSASGTGNGKGGALIRKALVVSQITLACTLLIGASVLIRSFVDLLRTDLGFEPEHVTAWRVESARQFGSPEEEIRYYDALVEHVAAIPGVESVGLSDTLPLGRNRTWGAAARGVDYAEGSYPVASPRIVDHRYLRTMRIDLRAGRLFDLRDSRSSARTLIVNETMAHALWPGQQAVGKTVVVGGHEGREMTVIGVVADVPPALGQAPRAEMYLNFHQITDWSAMELVVRADGERQSLLSQVQAAMNSYDPGLPTGEFTTLDRIVDAASAPQRFVTAILGAFSLLALALAATGVYGIVSWSVGRRTREMGIRFATGARRGQVLRLIVGEGLGIAATGIVAGLIAALLLSHVFSSMVAGARPADPAVLGIAACIVLGASVLASLVPARRAASVDPMEVLRNE